MKKKGFTLIELLAVIVILAIIALIATPMILGVIETARKGAAESSAYGYVQALENYQMKSQVTSTSAKLFDGYLSTNELNTYVDLKGDKPTNGYVEFESGKVIDYQLQFGNYLVKYNSTTRQAEANEEQYDETNVLAAYKIGDEVTIDGISYHVIKNSSSSDNTVTLLRDESIGKMAFDENGGTNFEKSTLKTYLNTKYKETFGDKITYVEEISLLEYGNRNHIGTYENIYINLEENEQEEGTLLYLYKNYKELFFNDEEIEKYYNETYGCNEQYSGDSINSINEQLDITWTKTVYSDSSLLTGIIRKTYNNGNEIILCGYEENFQPVSLSNLNTLVDVRPVITIQKEALD